MSKKSPTQRSLDYLRGQGLRVGIVERWIPIYGIPGNGKRSDLFGFIDIIAIDDSRTVGVQSCGQSFSDHHLKLTEERLEPVLEWLKNSDRELMLIGWRKLKAKRGGKLMLWKPRIRHYFRNCNGEIDYSDV